MSSVTGARIGHARLQVRESATEPSLIMIMNSMVPLVAAACGAVAGGGVAWGLELWRRRRDSSALMNALYGELVHIFEHYGYAGAELPIPESTTFEDIELRKALMWAKYGDVFSVSDLQRYGFLGPAEILQVLQISFRVRNTDSLIELLLGDLAKVTSGQLFSLRDRMHHIRESARQLAKFLLDHNPQLSGKISEQIFTGVPRLGP